MYLNKREEKLIATKNSFKSAPFDNFKFMFSDFRLSEVSYDEMNLDADNRADVIFYVNLFFNRRICEVQTLAKQSLLRMSWRLPFDRKFR